MLFAGARDCQCPHGLLDDKVALFTDPEKWGSSVDMHMFHGPRKVKAKPATGLVDVRDVDTAVSVLPARVVVPYSNSDPHFLYSQIVGIEVLVVDACSN